MKRTNPLTLLVLVPLGFVIGYAIDTLLVATGRTMVSLPWTMSTCLVLIGVAVIILGSRVRWATKPGPGRRIDPIAAVQILVAAKASSITGALVVGFSLGILVFTVSRPAVASTLVPQTIAGLVAGVILLICALVAEKLCEIPPNDSDGEPA